MKKQKWRWFPTMWRLLVHLSQCIFVPLLISVTLSFAESYSCINESVWAYPKPLSSAKTPRGLWLDLSWSASPTDSLWQWHSRTTSCKPLAFNMIIPSPCNLPGHFIPSTRIVDKSWFKFLSVRFEPQKPKVDVAAVAFTQSQKSWHSSTCFSTGHVTE